MKTVGQRIESRLLELGKSQKWLADGIGIKQPSVYAIINRGGTKHLLAIARRLGVSPEWLENESGPKFPGKGPQALLVGKVGAGAEIHRFEEGVVLASIEPPPGVGDCNAAEVEGDSMYPQLEAGWIVFYGPEHAGIPEECIGRLSIVQVKDGPILLKKLRRGSKKGLWNLESWNAPTREDVKIEWAAKVLDIRPR